MFALSLPPNGSYDKGAPTIICMIGFALSLSSYGSFDQGATCLIRTMCTAFVRWGNLERS